MDKQPEARRRLPPTSTTTRELYLYSGNQCAYPGCTSSLLKDNSTWNCEVAHIYGVKEGSARGEHTLTNEELRDVSNLLLMCQEHHSDIDNKALEGRYTVEVVRKMKVDHENRYREAISGLARIVDTSAGSGPRYPTNLQALDGFDDELERNIEDMKPWIDAIARQPLGIRDLTLLILVHGRPGNRWPQDRFRVKVTQIQGVATLSPEEVRDRARHLEDEGLLQIDEDEGIYFLELVDPTASNVGWDLFVELHKLAAGDKEILRRAIEDLDFTVLDR